MRVGLIAPPWVPVPPVGYGGTEGVIDRLARGLVAAGHEVALFATGDSTCPVPTGWVVPEARGDAMGDVVTEVNHVQAAYEALRDVDIVHDHTIAGPALALGLPETTVVTTNHNPFDGPLSQIYRRIARRVPIIAISHDQAARAGDIPIARVIHHGVDPEAFPLGAGDGGYLLFLGRMSPTKGVREAALVARDAGIPLVIAAKMRHADERAYFEAEVRPLLSRDIEYVGEVAGTEKLDLLTNARALANPISWPEPFGLVMIEALACGTPILAYPRGAAPEIIEHGVTGFLCHDRADMVRQARRLVDLDRAACRAAVERTFSTERMVADHLELYEWVLLARSLKGRRRSREVIDLTDGTSVREARSAQA